MADSKDRNSGFDSLKSLLISGATLGPVAIGLGLGIKAGLSTISTNKSLGDIATGGKPSDLEMIGRAVGLSRRGMIKQSLDTARAAGTNAMKSGSAHMNFFASMASGTSPQRNAMINAYLGMLNSAQLNLTQSDIASEFTELSAKSGDDLGKEIMSRIEKRAMEVGPEFSEGFLDELKSKARQILKLEEHLGTVSGKVEYFASQNTDFSVIKDNKIPLSYGSSVNQRFERLQKIISDATGESGSYKIAEVNTGGSRGLFVSGTVKGVHFDVPLALVRTGHMPGAAGGIMALNNTGAWSTRVVVGGSLDVTNKSIIQGEDFILDILEKTLKGNVSRSDVSESTMRRAFKLFKESAYDSSQFLTSGARELEYETAYKKAWQLQYFGNEVTLSNMLLDEKVSKLISPIGITPGGLVGQDNVRFLHQSNSPYVGELFRGYNEVGDIEQISRIQQVDKKYTIIRSNKAENQLVFADKLGWTSAKDVSYKQFLPEDYRNSLTEVLSKGKVTQLAFYQINPDEGFRKATGVYEGTSLTGKTFGTLSDTKTLRVMGTSNMGKGQSGALNYIFKRWQEQQAKNPGKPLRLSKKEINKIRKEYKINELILGYSPQGAPVTLKFNRRAHRGIEIGSIEQLTEFERGQELAKKTTFGESEYKISYRYANAAMNVQKAHSGTVKGTQVRTKANVLKQQAAFTIGESETERYINILRRQNPSYKNVESGMLITEAKHALRSKAFVNQSMITGALFNISDRVNQSEAQRILNEADQLSGNDLAKFITKEMSGLGFSSEQISPIVSAQYHFLKDSPEQAEAFLSEINKLSSSGDLSEVVRQSKGFVGLTSFALADIGSGVGKPAKLERRAYQGIIRHMKSLGASQDQIVSMLSDITSRGVISNEWEEVITNQTLRASGSGDLSQIKALSEEVGYKLNVIEKKASEMGLDVLGNENFTSADLIKVKLENENARKAAKNIFGSSDEIIIPGVRGTPSLSNLKIKRNGNIIDFPTEYRQSVQNLLAAIQDPHMSESEITTVMGDFKGNILKSWETSVESLMSAKISGSAQGLLQAVDKNTFGQARYEKLMETAKLDKYQSAFVSDFVFFKALKGLDEHTSGKEREEMIEKGRKFLFSRSENDAIYGIISRNPTLGEGHVPFRRIRRAGSRDDALDILAVRGVRKHLSETFGRKIKNDQEAIQLLGKLLSGSQTADSQKAQRKLVELLIDNINDLMGNRHGNIYAPTIEGTVNRKLHNFSFFTQMVADTDGDTASLILANGKDNIKFIRNMIGKGGDISNFTKAEAEWVAMKDFIKSSSKASTGVELSGNMLTLQKTLAEIRGKDVGRYSQSLDKLRVALLGYGTNDNVGRQGMAALSILEEMLIKTAKSNNGVVSNIADQFASAVEKGNIDEALNIIKTHAMGGRGGVISADYNMADEFKGRVDIDLDAMFQEIRDSFNAFQNSGETHAGVVKKVRNTLERYGYSERLMAHFASLDEGSGSLIGSAVNSMMTGNTESVRPGILNTATATIESSVKRILNKKAAIPIAIGAGVSLLALSMVAPGYSHKPLEMQDQALPEQVNRSIMSGSILSGFTNHINGQQGPTYNQEGYPDVSRNTLVENSAYVSDASQPSGRIEATINDINKIDQFNRISNALGIKSKQVYVQDARRPISKSTIDRIRED